MVVGGGRRAQVIGLSEEVIHWEDLGTGARVERPRLQRPLYVSPTIQSGATLRPTGDHLPKRLSV